MWVVFIGNTEIGNYRSIKGALVSGQDFRGGRGLPATSDEDIFMGNWNSGQPACFARGN